MPILSQYTFLLCRWVGISGRTHWTWRPASEQLPEGDAMRVLGEGREVEAGRLLNVFLRSSLPTHPPKSLKSLTLRLITQCRRPNSASKAGWTNRVLQLWLLSYSQKRRKNKLALKLQRRNTLPPLWSTRRRRRISSVQSLIQRTSLPLPGSIQFKISWRNKALVILQRGWRGSLAALLELSTSRLSQISRSHGRITPIPIYCSLGSPQELSQRM